MKHRHGFIKVFLANLLPKVGPHDYCMTSIRSKDFTLGGHALHNMNHLLQALRFPKFL